jgi:hypothetical protein
VQATVGLLATVCSTVGFAIGSAVCVATADATVQQVADQVVTAAVRLNRPAVASRSIPISFSKNQTAGVFAMSAVFLFAVELSQVGSMATSAGKPKGYPVASCH